MSLYKGTCPGCKAGINIKSNKTVDDWITCSHCGAELEIISLDPLELDWAFEEPDCSSNLSLWSASERLTDFFSKRRE